ncbi:MAG: hypothetical protein ACKPKO_32295, partial [Candidatus Fonsibacter sp.]
NTTKLPTTCLATLWSYFGRETTLPSPLYASRPAKDKEFVVYQPSPLNIEDDPRKGILFNFNLSTQKRMLKFTYEQVYDVILLYYKKYEYLNYYHSFQSCIICIYSTLTPTIRSSSALWFSTPMGRSP